MLAKAQQLVSQVNLGCKRSSTGSTRRLTANQTQTPNNEVKKPTEKSKDESKLPSRPNSALNRPKTKTPLPVYMNAPYRTESLTNSFKRSKSVTGFTTDKTSQKSMSTVDKSETEKRLDI